MPLLSSLPRRAATAAVLIATVAASAGCASFDDQETTADEGTFSEVPSEAFQQTAPTTPETPDETGDPPKGPCVDPDPAVIATCLGQTSGVRPADSEGKSTYVAERTSGKIILSKRYGPQRAVATVEVDGSGDGGLIDFELSPTWSEDQMIFALITTGSDNRIVRIAPTGSVKPILTGIPKGSTGNMGSIAFTGRDTLTVATGDAGDPASAGDPSSLAGKIFEINPNQPAPKPKIVARGLGSNVALCRDSDGGQMYVADSGASGDRLSLVAQNTLKTLWTWADRPGLTGCATGSGSITVSVASKKRLDVFAKPNNASPVLSEPDERDVKDAYGAIGRMTSLGGTATQFATINKSTRGSTVKSFDDRVATIMVQPGGESRL